MHNNTSAITNTLFVDIHICLGIYAHIFAMNNSKSSLYISSSNAASALCKIKHKRMVKMLRKHKAKLNAIATK